METVQNIVLIIFISLGLILIIKGYYPIVIHFLHIKNESTLRKRKIEQELSVLQSSQDSAKKADAFISLMNLSYVLVHTIRNKGNNYDDEIQHAKFKKSLTPELMKRLNSLEGKYE